MDNITAFTVSIVILLGVSLFLIYINSKLSKLYKLLNINQIKEEDE